jgi:hypothetical protein
MEAPVVHADPRSGLYLYCLFTGEGEPAGPGIDDRTSTEVLRYRALSALVSRVPLAEFGGEALERRCLDPQWLREKAERHDQIIRIVMETGPVLPIRFGTLYTRERRLRTLLATHYDDFHAFLESVTGAAEWGIKVYDERPRKRRSGTNTPAAAPAADASPGREYLLRKRAEKQQRGQAEATHDHAIGQILEQLSPLATQIQRNTPLSRRATGMAEEMVLNAACLVADEGVDRFREMLDNLARKYRDSGLRFQLSGPWAPYNFCPVVAQR